MHLLAFSAAMLASQPAFVDHPVGVSSVSGGVLERQCREHEGMEADFCAGYILGISDVLQATGGTCRPDSDVASRQTIEVVRRYLRDHPERWSDPPFNIVWRALADAFPCPRNRN